MTQIEQFYADTGSEWFEQNLVSVGVAMRKSEMVKNLTENQGFHNIGAMVSFYLHVILKVPSVSLRRTSMDTWMTIIDNTIGVGETYTGKTYKSMFDNPRKASREIKVLEKIGAIEIKPNKNKQIMYPREIHVILPPEQYYPLFLKK